MTWSCCLVSQSRFVRTLLRAVLPLPQLSLQQAAEYVVKHLDNRARSRKSRLKKAQAP